MKHHKYSLVYAKDLAVPAGGSTGNNEIVEFTSLWAEIKCVAQTNAARAVIRAGRYYWIRIVSKAETARAQTDEESFS